MPVEPGVWSAATVPVLLPETARFGALAASLAPVIVVVAAALAGALDAGDALGGEEALAADGLALAGAGVDGVPVAALPDVVPVAAAGDVLPAAGAAFACRVAWASLASSESLMPPCDASPPPDPKPPPIPPKEPPKPPIAPRPPPRWPA
jgi:hypothetical protein